MPLVRAVVAGGHVADLLMDPDNAQKAEVCGQYLEQWYGVDTERIKSFLAKIHAQAGEVQRLFDLPAGELGNSDDILMRANEALEQIGLSVTKQAQQLERNNEQLQQEVNTDGLTGVANRRSFDQNIEARFLQASAAQPMSVLFLDIDHFKQFNDTHGHAVGDEVLKLYAKVLAAAVGEQGDVYRYGGEEFAVVCSGMNRKDAAVLAERLREVVDVDVHVKGADGETHNATTSIGVATHDGMFFKNAGQVVKAADCGVYAAKDAGRNCVRVFVPKTNNKTDAA